MVLQEIVLKNEKKVKYGARAGLLERRGREDWRFSYLIFSKFIIFTFINYFTLCKIVMHLKKNYFFLSL